MGKGGEGAGYNGDWEAGTGGYLSLSSIDNVRFVSDEILLPLESAIEDGEDADGLLLIPLLCAGDIFGVEELEPAELAKVRALYG